MGQSQKSLCVTTFLMLVIRFAQYLKNILVVFITKSLPNDLEDKWQGQTYVHKTHILMLVITCTKYWNNLSNKLYRADTRDYVQSDGQDESNIHPTRNFIAGV